MGTPVVQILAERGHDIYVTSRRKLSSARENIHYLLGDAHNSVFMGEVLEEQFDAIIDFMIYAPTEFAERVQVLMDHTTQYMFFSSARVYADSLDRLITEESGRLLDVTTDMGYLQTNEYALAKAREEDVLLQGDRNNYTIIRPYITYNTERLQLGIFEKEMWLRRALQGKKIVFSNNIATKETTLTHGYDVALRIADLIGRDCALGQIYHITTQQSLRWSEVLEIYLDVLEEYLGYRPQVCMMDQCDPLLEEENHYQIHCDREYNRRFNNSKIQRDSAEVQPFIETRVGLTQCLHEFLHGEQHFRQIDWREEGVLDRISGDRTRMSDIPGIKNKIKYFFYRNGIR